MKQDAAGQPLPPIVLVAPQLSPVLGMESALLRLTRLLIENGYATRTVSLSGPTPDDWPGEVTSLHLGRGGRRAARAVPALHRLRREHPDAWWIGVGLWGYGPLLTAAGPDRHRVIAWEHSMLPWRLDHDRGVRLYARALAPLLPRAGAVVAVSESVAQTVEGLAPQSRTVVIPNLVSFDKPPTAATTAPGGDGLRLTSIGSLRSVKAFDLAVRAMAYLPDSTHLTIAGDGPERSNLEQLVAMLGLGERVTFAGHVDDIDGLLERTDVLVHPSYSETFGFTLLEAAWSRTPVVARNQPNMSAFVPTYSPGTTFQTDDPREVAAAITDIGIHHRPGDDAYTQSQRRIAGDFGVEAISEQWRELLKKLAESTENSLESGRR
jgi:glycosyltransferase involved in cell wall biosynthesis